MQSLNNFCACWSFPPQRLLPRPWVLCVHPTNRMNLATLVPRSDLASSKYCLANPGTEYLVYQPKAGEAFSVELKVGTYRYEWFDPTSGTVAGEGRVEALGGRHQFEAPFKSPSVLYLWKNASR